MAGIYAEKPKARGTARQELSFWAGPPLSLHPGKRRLGIPDLDGLSLAVLKAIYSDNAFLQDGQN
jgi:hypothetical protein